MAPISGSESPGNLHRIKTTTTFRRAGSGLVEKSQHKRALPPVRARGHVKLLRGLICSGLTGLRRGPGLNLISA